MRLLHVYIHYNRRTPGKSVCTVKMNQRYHGMYPRRDRHCPNRSVGLKTALFDVSYRRRAKAHENGSGRQDPRSCWNSFIATRICANVLLAQDPATRAVRAPRRGEPRARRDIPPRRPTVHPPAEALTRAPERTRRGRPRRRANAVPVCRFLQAILTTRTRGLYLSRRGAGEPGQELVIGSREYRSRPIHTTAIRRWQPWRRSARRHTSLNPDMLHAAILPPVDS